MTSAPDASSGATATASLSDRNNPWTITLSDNTLSTLTPRSQATRILIGERMVEGYTPTEIANELGQSASWVSERLNDLRDELLLANGRFFPLSDAEWESLRQSIAVHGVQTPIVIGEHIPLIDGRHRCLITQELGRDDVPAVFLIGKTPDEEHEISVALNAARRQLSHQQKRSLIRHELNRDPSRSDRRIGAVCGTDHKTVADVRTELAQEAALDAELAGDTNPYQPPARTDSIGRRQPTRPPRVVNGDTTDGDRPIGHADCCHGQRHAILRDGNGYRLETR